jgi:putative phosphoribosyl transferase
MRGQAMTEMKASGSVESTVRVTAWPVALDGDLVVPPDAVGVVAFAHGSGSSRHSPRNRQVADRLERRGFGTMLVDLLTRDEEEIDAQTGRLRFDIPLLADRLVGAVAWLDDRVRPAPAVGYFGASTGAAAALVASARQGDRIGAIVSRGGRPDLAGDALPAVRAPTLLIVGSLDETVVLLNQRASDRMVCERRMVIVPGATHLFEEPGALDQVAELAADWFGRHLAPAR